MMDENILFSVLYRAFHRQDSLNFFLPSSSSSSSYRWAKKKITYTRSNFSRWRWLHGWAHYLLSINIFFVHRKTLVCAKMVFKSIARRRTISRFGYRKLSGGRNLVLARAAYTILEKKYINAKNTRMACAALYRRWREIVKKRDL